MRATTTFFNQSIIVAIDDRLRLQNTAEVLLVFRTYLLLVFSYSFFFFGTCLLVSRHALDCGSICCLFCFFPLVLAVEPSFVCSLAILRCWAAPVVLQQISLAWLARYCVQVFSEVWACLFIFASIGLVVP